MLFRALLLAILTAGPTQSAETDYLKVVTNYANALITHGRDKYGPVKSPLIATTLERGTFGMIERDGAPEIAGVRDRERVFEGANPMHDQNLYQILFALTQLTGNIEYAQHADQTLAWFRNASWS